MFARLYLIHRERSIQVYSHSRLHSFYTKRHATIGTERCLAFRVFWSIDQWDESYSILQITWPSRYPLRTDEADAIGSHFSSFTRKTALFSLYDLTKLLPFLLHDPSWLVLTARYSILTTGWFLFSLLFLLSWAESSVHFFIWQTKNE